MEAGPPKNTKNTKFGVIALISSVFIAHIQGAFSNVIIDFFFSLFFFDDLMAFLLCYQGVSSEG